MNMRQKLIWMAVGLMLGSCVWIGNALFQHPKPSPQRRIYLALYEPPIKPPPVNSREVYAETVRDRDYGDETYVSKIAYQCGAKKISLETANDAPNAVFVALNDVSVQS
ncbi:MAG: hypothetical protein JWR77_350, partial [Rhizorhabdus sp.]|nr:hypothetical protein [Rhizorhabdus sp.]